MKRIICALTLVLLLVSCTEQTAHKDNTIYFDEYGPDPDTKENASPAVGQLIEELNARKDTVPVTVKFPKGTYHFYEDSAFVREYYISNHDQKNPKTVGFALEDLKNITIDGQGSEFIFHGRMIPFSILNGENFTLKNFSVDFEVPAIRQLKITEINKEEDELLAEIFPEDHYRIEDGSLILEGESFEITPNSAMAFRPDKKLTYNRADVDFQPDSVKEVSPNLLKIKGWSQIKETAEDERFVIRTYERPTPGIFIAESFNTTIENVQVHYAEGMGLLAQMSENITLEKFSVALKGDDDPRFFTTQADATHFSAVKGIISSKNGFYEGMADDAINVHGTYLRISKRVNDSTLQAEYMHPQAYGFNWGEQGDTVQFVESEKMELVDEHKNTLHSIKPVHQDTIAGEKEFEITFNNKLPKQISEKGKFAVENLTWTPEVVFANNTIKNNRARGTLFSTPKTVLVEDNLFDHTHGAAILLAGDANGWYETGMSHDVTIKNNKFINALTANYQFTNAIISIYPEIPKLEDQEKFFHSNIVIEGNTFETFDHPLLYAKSTDGITFKNNKIIHNQDFEPFHWNEHAFFFEKVDHVLIENNDFDKNLDPKKDIKTTLSDEDAVQVK